MDPLGTKDPRYKFSENFFIFRIFATILNFARNEKINVDYLKNYYRYNNFRANLDPLGTIDLINTT